MQHQAKVSHKQTVPLTNYFISAIESVEEKQLIRITFLFCTFRSETKRLRLDGKSYRNPYNFTPWHNWCLFLGMIDGRGWASGRISTEINKISSKRQFQFQFYFPLYTDRMGMVSPGTRCRTAVFLGTTDLDGTLPSRQKEKLPELILQGGQLTLLSL